MATPGSRAVRATQRGQFQRHHLCRRLAQSHPTAAGDETPGPATWQMAFRKKPMAFSASFLLRFMIGCPNERCISSGVRYHVFVSMYVKVTVRGCHHFFARYIDKDLEIQGVSTFFL